MAIDSATKRRAAAQTSVAWGAVSVTPDSAAPAVWRASSGWSYGLGMFEKLRLYTAAQTWAKVQPTDGTWSKAQPTDQTWSSK